VRRTLLETPIFTVIAERQRVPRTNARHDFIVLEMRDWINIVPVDDAGNVWLIRQPRAGSRKTELEIPGGATDARDASPLAAAKRELREETGCVARRWIRLGWVQPNPAFHRNRCHQFLALGVRRTGVQSLDPAESIRVTPTSIRSIGRLISTGGIRHALVLTALHAALARPETRRFR
jgi:8-oxo-dGTP pyrophosphatase MutT (NUDIX family)